MQGALVEREVTGNSARSLVLDLSWVVAEGEGLPVVLRILRGGVLIPTRKEVGEQAAERTRETEARAAEQIREAQAQAAEQARSAEARIRELEAELKRRG